MCYELHFVYKTYQIEVEIDGATGQVHEIDVYSTAAVDKNAVNRYENGRYVGKYSAQELETLLKAYFPQGKVEEVEMTRTRGLWVYDVEMRLPNGEVDALICPETGTVLGIDMEREIVSVPTTPIVPTTPTPVVPTTPTKPESSNQFLTEAQIREIVKKIAPQAVIQEIELDKDDGQWIYEVEAMDSYYEYELEISATTGKVLELDKDEIDD